MSNDVVIQVDAISKCYRLGVVGTGTLSHDLNRWWAQLRGKPDPYLKIGQKAISPQRAQSTQSKATENSSPNSSVLSVPSVVKNASDSEDPDFMWALRDVSFEVKRGEVLGIIGRNGAGKSTLLKILSRVTAPTTGQIRVKGRIAALLEVGTGFHPELTGKENIFLNGAILGMNKDEIRTKLDEIIAFSGIEKFIDTPVKRYSSGMYVRLAFAVAAHLDPEILILDEVLAVGDAEFQKKCLGKMGSVAKEGRTVLFVSHNMAAIASLCDVVITLNQGRFMTIGPPQDSIASYLALGRSNLDRDGAGWIDLSNRTDKIANEQIIIHRVRLLDDHRHPTQEIPMGTSMRLEVDVTEFSSNNQFQFGIMIKSNAGQLLASFNTGMKCAKIIGGRQKKERISLEIPKINLIPNRYIIDLSVAIKSVGRIDYVEHALTVDIIGSDVYGTGYHPGTQDGVIFFDGNWQISPYSSIVP